MDIAVVILNWNGKKMLERYLPSVVKSVGAFNAQNEDDSAFVSVADNGSDDGSVEWLRENRPDVRTILFEKNYGFAEGYNKALEQIDADYYILLNSDVETPEGWISPLFNFMEDHPEAGICQPKILSDASRTSFEYAGAAGGFIDRYGYPFCRGRILSHIEEDRGQYDTPSELFWASGACLMIRSSLFHHLCGFDASFFAHMEEIDLCWRAKLLGYEVWCEPASEVFHLGGGTLPNESPIKLYLNFRNNLLMLEKNLPESIRAPRIAMRLLLDSASAAVYLLTGNRSGFRAVIKAHRDFRKMKKDIEVSPFVEERNNAGYYDRSIVLNFFLNKGRLTFNRLRF